MARGIAAALRDLAVLVARGAAPDEVFGAISEQAAGVCGVSAAAVVRFTDAGAVIAGRWGAVDAFPAGSAFPLGAGGALTLVRNTGLPARFDEYERTGEDLRTGCARARPRRWSSRTRCGARCCWRRSAASGCPRTPRSG